VEEVSESVKNNTFVFTQFNSEWIKTYVPIGIALVLSITALILDITILSKKPEQQLSNNSIPAVSPSQPALCPQSCTELINSAFTSFASTPSGVNATASSLTQPAPAKTITPTLSVFPTLIPTNTPVPTPSSTPTPIPTVKEFFIPLGAGFESSTDWKVINGIGAKIDLANYGQIDKINFEVTVRIPNGNQTVYVRLYNASTYQTVENSELTLSSGTPTLLISNTINLSAGSNSYQIQMKTQLGYQTHVDQARIRIVTK